ncbi:MAG: 16S rRNA (guanine(966)-N(2))-methyltransferase RsmD [Desulfobacterales bacterium]|nr:16S rRNA (guanine(966)-N(2))-methyltransferase RsmD [Desulfobacterales bacterium]
MGLRVIAGSLRGRKLSTVKGNSVRPTADRVRESIFNILSAEIAASQILDLFSGTGALGIEALSRGAEAAVFVDRQQNSLAAVEKNINVCGLLEKTKIICWNISHNLSCLKAYRERFNMVFMDPPYNKNHIAPTLLSLKKSESLCHNAIITVEHSPQELIPEDIESFTLKNQRKYGRTMISFLTYKI